MWLSPWWEIKARSIVTKRHYFFENLLNILFKDICNKWYTAASSILREHHRITQNVLGIFFLFFSIFSYIFFFVNFGYCSSFIFQMHARTHSYYMSNTSCYSMDVVYLKTSCSLEINDFSNYWILILSKWMMILQMMLCISKYLGPIRFHISANSHRTVLFFRFGSICSASITAMLSFSHE